MLTTIYRNEQGVIDKVVLTAQNADESNELLRAVEGLDKRKADGSGTLRYNEAKGDYSQRGDPYGIEKTYTAESAAVDVRGNSLPISRPVPTQEEADAIVLEAQRERDWDWESA